jgi:hypothetical protein
MPGGPELGEALGVARGTGLWANIAGIVDDGIIQINVPVQPDRKGEFCLGPPPQCHHSTSTGRKSQGNDGPYKPLAGTRSSGTRAIGFYSLRTVTGHIAVGPSKMHGCMHLSLWRIFVC